MKKQLDQLLEWHKAFKVPYSERPKVPGFDRQKLRCNLLFEEVCELEKERHLDPAKVDIQKVAKELADIAYVLFGTVVEYGLQDEFERVFDEVNRSNFSKLDDNGQPIFRSDGKVLKSPNYSPADLSFLIEKKHPLN